MTARLVVTLSLLAATFALAACGGDTKPGASSASPSAKPAGSATPAASASSGW